MEAVSAGLHLSTAGVLHEERLRRDQRLLVQSFSTGRSEGGTSESERLQQVTTFSDHLGDIGWRGELSIVSSV